MNFYMKRLKRVWWYEIDPKKKKKKKNEKLEVKSESA